VTILDAARKFSRVRAEAIEERLALAVALKKDLAVTEEWAGMTLTISFKLVAPGEAPPPTCTLYKASEFLEPRGRK
jgi:hypothetical protein